ncbi:MAG: sulfite exporter TauE/SafE family protein [Actinomycetota bacterium]|nr:sulfite exporter TauE/SafE family protein [Actinomycetota bacterium]
MAVELTVGHEVLLGLAGLGAGIVNGVAGGGSLVSFPALLAVGFPALSANVTSTVGIWPGYLGGAAGFARELSGQRRRFLGLLPALLVGSIGGGVLLLTTPSSDFAHAAPYLVLFACALFALQPRLARSLGDAGPTRSRRVVLQIATALSAAYGAYFGAGLGVILLGVLASCIPDRLVRINGLRSVLSLAINTVAALIFAADAPVSWVAAGTLALGALCGGYSGARLARRLPAIWLRAVVIALGLATAAKLLAG